MPRPCLPVDSAISCSTHSPKAAIRGLTTNVALLRPCSASVPSMTPMARPGLASLSSRHSMAASAAERHMWATSTPASAAGTRPK